MRKLLFLFILILSACNRTTSIQGRYYPKEYRQELNLSQLSTISISNHNLSAGEYTEAFVQSFDSNGNIMNVGGGIVSFFSEGTGKVVFSEFKDLNNGQYSVKIQAIKNGSVIVKASLNPAVNKVIISDTTTLNISIGSINLLKSTLTLSSLSILVNQPITFTLTIKDSLGNIINDNSLQIYPTLTNGSIEGSFGTINYLGNGQYQGTFTPTSNGTSSYINLSIRNIGFIQSQTVFSVVN